MGWGPIEYLIAEQTDVAAAQFAVATKGRGRVKLPDPVYRPPKPDKVVEPVTTQSLDDFDVKGLLAMIGAG